MLIEMVVLSLTVLSTLSAFSAQSSSEVVLSSRSLESTMPEEKIVAMLTQGSDRNAFADMTLPEERIVAMFTEPTPTQLPTPTATPRPIDTPTPARPETPSSTPTPIKLGPTDTPTPTPVPVVIASPTDIDGFFERYSSEYNVDKELLRRIAVCESSYNSQARNDIYGGMYQFADSTWSTVRGRMGHDPNPDLRFNAEESIKTAAYHIANGGQNAWPNC